MGAEANKDMRQLRQDKINLLKKYEKITPIVQELISESDRAVSSWPDDKRMPVIKTRLEEFLELSAKEDDKKVTTIAHNPLIESLNLITEFMQALPKEPEKDKDKRDVIIDMDKTLKELNTELQAK